MILKTPAVVLRQHPYTETSRVVTWLTPDRGRINTLIKGALRPKSLFLGQTDLFYTCELLYYAKAGDSLPVTRECTAVKMRPSLRDDWRACAVASYLTSLVNRGIPEKASRHDIFDWLEAALDDLATHGGSVSILCWHELKFLRLLGLAPRLERCRQCGSLPSEKEVAFSIADGGWLCARCRKNAAPRNAIWTPVAALRHLVEWQKAETPAAARNAALPFSQQSAIERIPGLFLVHHLDVSPAPRAAALDILSRQPPRPVDRDTRVG